MSHSFVLFQHPLFSENESTVMAERGCVHGKGSDTTDLIPANHLFYIHLSYQSQMLKASPFETCHFIFSQLLAKSWTTGKNRIEVLEDEAPQARAAKDVRGMLDSLASGSRGKGKGSGKQKR